MPFTCKRCGGALLVLDAKSGMKYAKCTPCARVYFKVNEQANTSAFDKEDTPLQARQQQQSSSFGGGGNGAVPVHDPRVDALKVRIRVLEQQLQSLVLSTAGGPRLEDPEYAVGAKRQAASPAAHNGWGAD